jgi:SdrD B-like domain/Secretion system C-terminal sorting domain
MKKISTILFVVMCVACNLTLQAQTTGTVFRDFNGNGTRQSVAPFVEPVVTGIIVNAFNSTDVLIASYTTDAAGNFSIPLIGSVYNGTPGSNTGAVANAEAVRLEFVIPAAGVCGLSPNYDYSSSNGIVHGTSTRFVNGGSVNNNYAVNNPAQFVSDAAPFANSFLAVPIIQVGSTGLTGPNPSGAENAFVKFPYNRSGTTPLNTPAEVLATNAQIGAVYGQAYSAQAKKIFTSAFMKRHSGFGPADGVFNNAPGAIYIINPALNSGTGAASYFGSLDALGYPTHNSTGTPAYGNGTSFTISGTMSTFAATGTGSTINYPSGAAQGVIGTNADRGLPNDISLPSNDPAAFGQVGTVSLGDMDISDDGQFLFVVNLYDRKIYQLQLNNVSNPTAATFVASYTLPNPPLRSASGLPGAASTYTGADDNTDFYTGNRGIQRPFALKYYRGKLYVGAVTTGEGPAGASTTDDNAGIPEYTDLWSYVWELDPSAGTFAAAPSLQHPLNFGRGINADVVNEGWNPWTRTVVSLNPVANEEYLYYPQPMLTDIEFDVDGSMILAFRDRVSDQYSYDQPGHEGADQIFGIAVGDQLRAYPNGVCNGWVMEANGDKDGPGTYTPSGAQQNGQGPSNYAGSNGEFYFNDNQINGYHLNTCIGSMAFLPGSENVAATYMDPVNGNNTNLWSGGISWMNNNDGTNTNDYELYIGELRGRAGKTGGLGDLELLNDAAPIELGNRVWNDVDGDGIQDAGEAGLAGVEMELLDGIGTVIGTVTTAADGSYYFSSATGTNAPGIAYGINIQPNTNYTIRVKGTVTATNTITGNAGLGATDYFTTINALGNGQADWSDNDAARVGGTGGRYQVSVTTGANGQNNHTIDFGFSPINVLPAKVITFTAQPQGNQVALRWTVADQSDISAYEVEVSTNGRNFNNVTSVTANNDLSATYNAAHLTPALGISYYRIKFVDKNGAISYSDIRKVNFGKAANVNVFPNPAKIEVNVTLTPAMINKAATISVISIDGRLMTVQKVSAASQIETIDVSKMANGKYIVRIVTGNEVINKTIEVIR